MNQTAQSILQCYKGSIGLQTLYRSIQNRSRYDHGYLVVMCFLLLLS